MEAGRLELFALVGEQVVAIGTKPFNLGEASLKVLRLTGGIGRLAREFP